MIQIEDLAATAGRFRMRNICLDLAEGRYGVLMGQTGSGKTTLLECLCGLRAIDRGRIVLSGRDVTNWPPACRAVGYVPQDGALFPTMSVYDHLAFALTVRKWTRPDREQRVAELARWLRIDHLLDRRPSGLSGGEAQRVALGRALSFSPKVLLLDEPLSALDEATRQQMCDLLKEVQRVTGVTALHVTHSRAEARRLGDCVYQLRDGRVTSCTDAMSRPAKVEESGSR